MFAKLRNGLREIRLSLKTKTVLALSAIAVVLLSASLISFLEYRRMSGYVSEMIAGDVSNIHVTQRLVDAVDTYNLQVLAVIGDENLSKLPDFDRSAFLTYCDSLKNSLGGGNNVPLADSVIYAYSAYMLASMELEDVLESNFIDTRDWYFERLQPIFQRMRGYLERLGEVMYRELESNSSEFDNGFSRSIIPGATAILVGIMLVFLLLFYILVYYVKPLYGMLDALTDFLAFRRRYTFDFESDDQMGELNEKITELTEENRQVRRRIVELKEKTQSES